MNIVISLGIRTFIRNLLKIDFLFRLTTAFCMTSVNQDFSNLQKLCYSNGSLTGVVLIILQKEREGKANKRNVPYIFIVESPFKHKTSTT